MRSFSFCITCKNRLHHFKQTYFNNIALLDKYDIDYEVILLDYDSTDGLSQWIMDNSIIKKEKFSYFISQNKKYYKEAHSKNVCHKLAKNKIIINLDVDNILNSYFLDKLIDLNDNEILMTKLRTNGTCGRISLYKEHFLKLGGYDETRQNIVTRCYIDSDFKLRSLKYGLKCKLLDHNKLEFIDHSNYDRSINYEKKLLTYTDIDIKDPNGAKKTYEDIRNKKYIANTDILWGSDTLIYNLDKTIFI